VCGLIKSEGAISPHQGRANLRRPTQFSPYSADQLRGQFIAVVEIVAVKALKSHRNQQGSEDTRQTTQSKALILMDFKSKK